QLFNFKLTHDDCEGIVSNHAENLSIVRRAVCVYPSPSCWLRFWFAADWRKPAGRAGQRKPVAAEAALFPDATCHLTARRLHLTRSAASKARAPQRTRLPRARPRTISAGIRIRR